MSKTTRLSIVSVLAVTIKGSLDVQIFVAKNVFKYCIIFTKDLKYDFSKFTKFVKAII